jgi:glycerol-3-phosphate dehydrogenase
VSGHDTPFDVAIIGAGVCGASIAHALCSRRLRVVLLEKAADVCFGVSKANSGIVHGGFHHPGALLKSRLELAGAALFDRLHRRLHFPFKRVGICVVAFSDEEMKTVERLYARGKANGVKQLEICGAERIMRLEPGLNTDAVGGLYAPDGGIIEPYRYVFALTECARQNGVSIRCGFDVVRAEDRGDAYVIHSDTGDAVRARYVVNAAGLYADDISRLFGGEQFRIKARKGEEYLLDRNAACHPRHVLFPVPATNSKGILVIPTVEGTTMIGPTAEMVDDKTDVSAGAENLQRVFTHAKHMVPAVSRRDIITAFAGLRATLDDGDFFIACSQSAPRLIQVAGIQSPGLTASPAIGEYVRRLLEEAGLTMRPHKGFRASIAAPATARDTTADELAALIERDPRYGAIVCRCERVSEAEIVEAIHKGHDTLDGIKFYTRAGMGRCQGGFCTYKILKILARETGRPMSSFTKRGGGSALLYGELGGAGAPGEGAKG